MEIRALTHTLWPLSSQLSQLANKLHYTFAQQRLATRQTDLGDPHPHEHAHHAQIIRERQVCVERAFISRAAVNTLIVAAIGDGDPQIGYGATEFVGKSQALGSWLLAVSFWLAFGGLLTPVELGAKSQDLKAVDGKDTDRRDNPGGCCLSNALLA